jgi:hypothetical protein
MLLSEKLGLDLTGFGTYKGYGAASANPINMPALGAKEKSLEGEDDQVVYEKYIGETVISVKGRQRTNLRTVTFKFALSRWLHTGDLGDATPAKSKGYTKHV